MIDNKQTLEEAYDAFINTFKSEILDKIGGKIMSIFDKWNKAIDGKKLADDFKDIEENGGQFEDVPKGKYVVKIDKMELKESRNHDPMFSAWFKITDGNHKNSLIFMNQLITKAFQIHIVCEFLRSLDTGIDINFDGNYEHFNNTILDVAEEAEKCEFLLDYGETAKGYSTFKILEIYDA